MSIQLVLSSLRMKTTNYRLRVALLLLLIFTMPRDAFGVQAPKPVASPITAEDWYNSSVNLLQNGRDFDRAAAQLRKALAIQDRMQYHVALGCAMVSRAVALAQATLDRKQFSQDEKKYQDWLAKWEMAQKDPSNANFGKPRPEPPVLQTRDDHRPFSLLPE